jgi:hypothetical protein
MDGNPCSVATSPDEQNAPSLQCKNGQCDASSRLEITGVYSASQPNVSSLISDLLNNSSSKRSIIIIASVFGPIASLCVLFFCWRCVESRKVNKLIIARQAARNRPQQQRIIVPTAVVNRRNARQQQQQQAQRQQLQQQH